MTNNLVVKFRKRAFKLKKVVAIITLKELSATNSRKKRF